MPRPGRPAGRRNISQEEMRRWLVRSEQGELPEEIGEDEGHPVRRVKRGIESAKRERITQAAQSQIFQNALERHNQELAKQAGLLAAAIKVTRSHQLTPLAHFPESSVVEKYLIDFEIRPDVHRVRERISDHPGDPSDGKKEQLTELLRQHLSDRRTHWTKYDAWTEAHSKYGWLCYRLGDDVGEMIIEETGLRPQTAAGPVDGFRERFISLVCELALKQSAAASAYLKLNKPIVVQSQLRLGGDCLAETPKKKALKKCVTKLPKLVTEAAGLENAFAVVDQLAELKKDAPSPRQLLSDVALIGVVPGSCRVCKLIGIG